MMDLVDRFYLLFCSFVFAFLVSAVAFEQTGWNDARCKYYRIHMKSHFVSSASHYSWFYYRCQIISYRKGAISKPRIACENS
jgi:hypothetical protein